MVRYRDLIGIPVADNGEPFTSVSSAVILNGYIPPMTDMKTILGSNIVVRTSVLARLVRAQLLLRQVSPALSLYLTYGYRSLAVQTKKFLDKLSSIAKTRYFENPFDLYEEIHRYIAVPSVAGHPTGGAVDITVRNERTGTLLDFGSSMYDYTTKNSYVFAPVSSRTRKNRLLLRKVMTEAGFAPFDGEWWHFSYGDREWAYYYEQFPAIYGQCSVQAVRDSLTNSV